MHRFYLPLEPRLGQELLLRDAEAHHASRVLRLKPGDEATVLNGSGVRAQTEVVAIRRTEVTVRPTKIERVLPPPADITLFQAIPRGKLIEAIIQKATELGARRIVPLLTERVVTDLDQRGVQSKQEKWQAVAVEAMKQCGTAWLPRVERPIKISGAFGQVEPAELSIAGSLYPDAKSARVYFDEFVARERRLPKSVGIWVGPEGDFTRAEIDSIVERGARPITLGPLVLRVETAAISCLAIVNHELQSRHAA